MDNLLEKMRKINVIRKTNRIDSYYKVKLKNNPEILEQLITATKFLDSVYDVTLHQRVYTVLYSITAPPICKHPDCNNIIKFSRKYLNYCSIACSANSCEVRVKFKRTCLKKFGHEYPLQSKKIQNKKKQTCLKKFGFDNPVKSEEVKEKMKQTNLEIYGHEYASQANEVKEKQKHTMISRYGVEHALQLEDFKEKSKQTFLRHFGVEHALQVESIREKFNHTMISRYGVEHALQLEDFKEKSKQTFLRHFGVENHTQKHIDTETLSLLNNKDWIYDQHINQKKTLKQIASELNIGDCTVGKYLHSHNIEAKRYYQSIGERAVLDFIEFLNIETISNTRKIIPPYELDIYIPEHNLAIEYNGLYWHSEQAGKDKHYHKRKYDMCAAIGIQLITIFEDEWFDRQEQVKSKLLSLLGMDNRGSIFARKTQITIVSKKTKSIFFDKNHIQGTGQGSINIGLTYNNKLVACMTFIKRKNDKYELNRYATSARVVGGFSKLLKHFINEYQPKEIISFADLRWSTGNLYTKTGWKIDKILLPDYSYSPDAKQRIHKFSYRRKNLPKLLENFDPSLSEKINCDNNGILRIWDCGKIRFKYLLDI